MESNLLWYDIIKTYSVTSNSRKDNHFDGFYEEAIKYAKEYLGDEFLIEPKSNITGFFNDKETDLVFRKNDRLVGILETKSVMKSYAKNKNNAFENMIGYIVNVKLNNIKIMWSIFQPYKIPKEKNGNIQYDIVSNEDIEKYNRLYECQDEKYKPDNLSLNIFGEYDVENKKLYNIPDNIFNQKSIDILLKLDFSRQFDLFLESLK